MPYAAYNTNIFQSAAVNTICNKLVDTVIVEFSQTAADTQFLLSGCAAVHLQSPTDNNEVPAVVFVTNSRSIYSYFVQSIGTVISVTSSIAYADRLQFESEGVKFEIWNQAGYGFVVLDYQGIKIQDESTMLYFMKNENCIAGTATANVLPLLMRDPQAYLSGENELYHQNWVFSPEKITSNWVQGEAVPENAVMGVQIKNFENDDEFEDYDDFKLQITSGAADDGSDVGGFFDALINGSQEYNLVGADLNIAVDISYINLQFLQPGQYRRLVKFTVLGSLNGIWGILEKYDKIVELNVFGSSEVYADPQTLTFNYFLGDDLPAPKQLYLNVLGEYTITYDSKFTFLADGLSDESTSEFTVKRANGPRTFQVSPNFNASEAEEGHYFTIVNVDYQGGNYKLSLRIIIGNKDEIAVTPSRFDFEAIRGYHPAEPQEINIDSDLPYTYELPAWLNVSGDIGKSFTGLLFPSSADNFQPGRYTGVIKLSSEAGLLEIPVTYLIRANRFSDLIPRKLNFCDDPLFINYHTHHREVFLRASMAVTFTPDVGRSTEIIHQLHVPIFKGLATFHPGSIVSQMMPSFSDINTVIPDQLAGAVEKPFAYYRPVSATIRLDVWKYANGAQLVNEVVRDLIFVKGSTPENYNDDCGVMFAQHPMRVTKNSFAMVNFFKRSGLHSIEVYLNGKKERSIRHDTLNDSVFGMLVNFENYNEGDLVFVNINDGHSGNFQRKFYVFPENKECYHIAWVTAHEQVELLEFTGSLAFSSEYDRVQNKVFKNLVNATEVLSTDRVQSVQANTGWILKNNHILIDSLLSSRKAWLILPDASEKIELVPKSKKMSNYDSDRALYAYDVEFTVNQNKNAEVYPK